MAEKAVTISRDPVSQELCRTAQRGMDTAVRILGDKWTPRLLFALSEGPLRFGQLRSTVGGVNPRTLSARLGMLEAQGILDKVVYQQMPPHTEYSLTRKGHDFLPIIQGMIAWSERHSENAAGATVSASKRRVSATMRHGKKSA